MTRLTNDFLYKSNIPQGLSLPRYNRAQKTGVVHLGVGAFHRAHQAVYFDRLMRQGHKDWMILGASLRSPTVAEQLNPQDGLFTVVQQDGTQTKHQIIGSVRKVLVGPNDPQALIGAMADPRVSLITLTITEKGYRPALATGGFDLSDPGVVNDISNPGHPRTALGYVTAALAQRKASHGLPLTVLSCDNMPNNGQTTRRGVLAFAKAIDVELADWIDASCAFPSSMVDRIVPATTEADKDTLERTLGVRDEAMVKTEAFTQWVVEDNFVGRRPELDKVGVQFTNDVEAWEKAKLRLLNGAHSALAYLGGLAGYKFIHQTISVRVFEMFINRLWDEVGLTLDALDGFDLEEYRDELASRFKNADLEHRTHQIAEDGSQKIPQRWLNSMRDLHSAGYESPALSLALAAWMRWQFAYDDAGRTFDVHDPIAAYTNKVATEHSRSPRAIVANLIAIDKIFPKEIVEDVELHSRLSADLSSLLKNGTHQTLARLVGELDLS